MRRFFLKTALLIALLFCAVLYGMDVAKQGMMKMEGGDTKAQTSSLFDFNIPGLGAGSKKENVNQAEAAELSPDANAKNEAKPDDMESRLSKLDDINSFNPYSAMGDKLSNGISSVFEKGISAAATLVNQLLN
ncbi:MAG: DUF3679 domain-containing protein [Tuberibacillus sp.]